MLASCTVDAVSFHVYLFMVSHNVWIPNGSIPDAGNGCSLCSIIGWKSFVATLTGHKLRCAPCVWKLDSETPERLQKHWVTLMCCGVGAETQKTLAKELAKQKCFQGHTCGQQVFQDSLLWKSCNHYNKNKKKMQSASGGRRQMSDALIRSCFYMSSARHCYWVGVLLTEAGWAPGASPPGTYNTLWSIQTCASPLRHISW